MSKPRYVVFDDAPQCSTCGYNADEWADELRVPLAAIGVRVVRHHGACSSLLKAGFQAHGWSRKQYRDKLNAVDRIVARYAAGRGGAPVQQSLKAAMAP
jgi:hypothetical protein